MKTKTTAFIKDVNEEMQAFSVDLKAYAVPEIERIQALLDQGEGDTVDGEQLSDEMVTLLEIEVLNQHLDQSKDNVESKIIDMENTITKAIGNDQNSIDTRIVED